MMAQSNSSNQAIESEVSVSLSAEAKAAPYNAAASLSAEFTVVAEKEVLPCLYAFCTFLGKTHEAGPLCAWPASGGEDARKALTCVSTGAPEGEVGALLPARQLVSATCELPLSPFGVPASFCEQLAKESVTFTVVRIGDPRAEGSQGPQRKEPQPKCSGKSEGKDKGGKKGGAPRPTVPQGETRTAEIPAAMLLVLKDGERMQAPEETQKTLTTLPGIVSFRIAVRAVKSLLSPELRHLLNPMWLLIKEVRFLPSVHSFSPQSASKDIRDGVAAQTAAVASGGDSKKASEEPSANKESMPLGHTSSISDAPLQYFARASAFSKVLETQPRTPSVVSGASCVCWNTGFLCFWGPSIVNQNELKDFIEEQRLEVELHHTAEYSGEADPSDLAWTLRCTEISKQVSGKNPLKQQQKADANAAKKRRATAKPPRSQMGTGQNNSISESLLSTGSNGVNRDVEGCPIRAPHGVASFRLSALASCGVTNLSFCADVLPVAGYTLRKGEAGEATSICKVNGPDFMKSGTRMTIEIRLAEPLFQSSPFTVPLGPTDSMQEPYAIWASDRTPVLRQEINRLFLSAPLHSRLASEATRLVERENTLVRDMPACQLADGVEIADEREGGVTDRLTGFLIQDGRFLYAVFEGLAEGRLAEAAELLVAAASEDDGESAKVLYNSRLRFSDRQYPVITSLQRLELAAPLAEVASSRAMLNVATADARHFSSAVSKLQMATFLSRAADLKCHNLFPTDEELRYLRRFVGR